MYHDDAVITFLRYLRDLVLVGGMLFLLRGLCHRQGYIGRPVANLLWKTQQLPGRLAATLSASGPAEASGGGARARWREAGAAAGGAVRFDSWLEWVDDIVNDAVGNPVGSIVPISSCLGGSFGCRIGGDEAEDGGNFAHRLSSVVRLSIRVHCRWATSHS